MMRPTLEARRAENRSGQNRTGFKKPKKLGFLNLMVSTALVMTISDCIQVQT